MGRKKQQSDHRAATRGGGWTGLPHVVQDSAAYRALSDRARCVLLEVVRRFNGFNNGEIGISTRELADRLSTQNHGAISKALADLVSHGLIDVAAEGQWKPRAARLYRLTFVNSGPGGRVAATEEYRHWTPDNEQSGAENVSARPGKSAEDASAVRESAAENVSARIAQHRRKSVAPDIPAAEHVSALIYNHTLPPNPADDDDTPKGQLRAELSRIRSSGGARLLSAFAANHGCSPEEIAKFARRRGDLTEPKVSRLLAAIQANPPVKRRILRPAEAI